MRVPSTWLSALEQAYSAGIFRVLAMVIGKDPTYVGWAYFQADFVYLVHSHWFIFRRMLLPGPVIVFRFLFVLPFWRFD